MSPCRIMSVIARPFILLGATFLSWLADEISESPYQGTSEAPRSQPSKSEKEPFR
jgi:hypothetical protein